MDRGNVARLAGIEPATPGLEGRCSIRLSYRRVQNQVRIRNVRGIKLVGMSGFEPPRPCSQSHGFWQRQPVSCSDGITQSSLLARRLFTARYVLSSGVTPLRIGQ